VATASTITATGVDTWDAQPVTPGWIDKAGTPLVSSNVAGWLFSNQSTAVSAPGSVSTTLDTITGAPIRTLSFNFGCSTLAVALRTTDCRNVVAMYAPTAGSLALSANAAISFDVRNADASAQFALRVKDSSGQTLQYRFPTRSIESGATSNWVSVIIPLRNPDSYWGGANNGQPQGTLSEVAIVASALNANSATLGMNYPVGKIEVREPELHSSTCGRPLHGQLRRPPGGGQQRDQPHGARHGQVGRHHGDPQGHLLVGRGKERCLQLQRIHRRVG